MKLTFLAAHSVNQRHLISRDSWSWRCSVFLAWIHSSNKTKETAAVSQWELHCLKKCTNFETVYLKIMRIVSSAARKGALNSKTGSYSVFHAALQLVIAFFTAIKIFVTDISLMSKITLSHCKSKTCKRLNNSKLNAFWPNLHMLFSVCSFRDDNVITSKPR